MAQATGLALRLNQTLPELSDEPDWVVDATNADGDGATRWCENEAEAKQVFKQFTESIQNLGDPMPPPA